MIKAAYEDVETVSDLLFDMYQEVSGDKVSSDKDRYTELAIKHLVEDDVWLSDDRKSFFIMRDESNPVLKEKLWNGVSVYIDPEQRAGKTLKLFYDFMFNNYKGVIMGYTDVNSAHNKVLIKRHTLLGHVYKMERS